MGRPKKIKPFDIPEDILAKVDECSNGAFMLFCFDDFQNFRCYSNFDSEMHFKALKSDIEKWINAVSHIESQQVLMSLVNDK